MSAFYEVAVDGLRVSVGGAGVGWSLNCQVSECPAFSVGWAGRDVALKASLHHLIWHLNGKPTCRDCGQWLAHRTSTRCRKGTCEATS